MHAEVVTAVSAAPAGSVLLFFEGALRGSHATICSTNRPATRPSQMLADSRIQCAGTKSAIPVAIPRIAMSSSALRRPNDQRLVAARRNNIQAQAESLASLAIQTKAPLGPIP